MNSVEVQTFDQWNYKTAQELKLKYWDWCNAWRNACRKKKQKTGREQNWKQWGMSMKREQSLVEREGSYDGIPCRADVWLVWQTHSLVPPMSSTWRPSHSPCQPWTTSHFNSHHSWTITSHIDTFPSAFTPTFILIFILITHHHISQTELLYGCIYNILKYIVKNIGWLVNRVVNIYLKE